MAYKTRWPVFTEEWARKIVDEHLAILCLNLMLFKGGMAFYEVGDRRFYVIYLRSSFRKEIGSPDWHETFVHELIHIFHNIYGLSTREKRVEKECVDFYAKHKTFVEALLRELLNGSKCLRHSLPSDSPYDTIHEKKPEEVVLSILKERYEQC